LIRHGETDTNSTRRIAGRYQANLTELGLWQAALTAEYLRDIPFDAVYASNLTRAIDTAKIIVKPYGLPVYIESGLAEINLGDWENLTMPEVQAGWPASYDMWMHHQGQCVCPNGESVPQVQARFAATLQQIACYHEGKNICVVSHGLAIKTFYAKVCNYSLDTFRSLPYSSNASVSIFTCENGAFALQAYNQDAHLGDCKTELFPEA